MRRKEARYHFLEISLDKAGFPENKFMGQKTGSGVPFIITQ